MSWKETHKKRGIFKIFENKNKTEFKQIDEIENILTNLCLDHEVNFFQGTLLDVAIRYLAVGDTNTAPVVTNTTINNETFRTFYVSRSKTGTGELTTEFYINDSEMNGEDIQELGIFGGVTATSTTDSGILLSHALWNYGTKTSSVELLIKRVDTIS